MTDSASVRPGSLRWLAIFIAGLLIGIGGRQFLPGWLGAPNVGHAPANRAQSSAVSKQSADRTMFLAIHSFKFRGKPINPRIVKLFMPWMSDDGGATVVGVDLKNAAEDVNQFDESNVTLLKNGAAFFDTAKSREIPETFDYRVLGHLRGGTVVLLTSSGGGGSGDFEDLLFLQIRRSDQNHDLLLRWRRDIPLGDRYSGKITVQPNEVIIGACKIPFQSNWKRTVIHWGDSASGS